jgi:hypothetical protein
MPGSVPREGEKEAIIGYINDLINSGVVNYTTDDGYTTLMFGGPNWKPHSIGRDHYLIYKPRAALVPQVGSLIDARVKERAERSSTPPLLPREGGKRKKTRRKRTNKRKSKKKRTKDIEKNSHSIS